MSDDIKAAAARHRRTKVGERTVSTAVGDVRLDTVEQDGETFIMLYVLGAHRAILDGDATDRDVKMWARGHEQGAAEGYHEGRTRMRADFRRLLGL